MRVVVAVVGKPRDANLAGAIREYEARAARYWPLDVREVRQESAADPSGSRARDAEAKRLLVAIPPAAQVVACDVSGRSFTSERFAEWLQEARERAVDVAFVIGGAFGLGEPLKSRVSSTLSLAPWTLPHELARLVLVEQLYRAGTIIRREPYHK
jgi:23S rRNA (pseudouridine1915-N3)-methyltransferase